MAGAFRPAAVAELTISGGSRRGVLSGRDLTAACVEDTFPEPDS